MRLLSRLTNGIRALFRRGIVDEELDAELHAFLDTAVDEKMRSGMSREEATRAARLETGLVSAHSVKERVREVGWENVLETTWQDVRYAMRVLRRSPLFTATATLSLAIGVGASTSIFTVANALLLRAAPGVSDPNRLVDLVRRERDRGPGIAEISYRRCATSVNARRHSNRCTATGYSLLRSACA